ncbi:MAG: DUF1194 domain-containing protein [Roseitalea porphyridii]|jgi:Ca-activated chloride channel family protein|uniref:DUF1194 domain-containing protein n=2 Tax=Roseitalea porphyridii TaxID=1852022 RepID=UPI0032ED5CFB
MAERTRRTGPILPARPPVVMLALVLVSILWAVAPVRAQPQCALSLILAIDVSSSVDDRDYRLQMDGLAEAFRDPQIREAITRVGGIQVTAYEWSGRRQQVEIAPWTFLAGDASVLALADRLQAHPRGHTAFPTALGYALGHAASLFRSAPLDCTRKVIDVSGDGVNNEGFSPELAYANFPFEGVQVNGLVIAGARPDPVVFYQEHVLYGPGAFLEIADGFADFEAAMKRKLLREIIGGALSGIPDQRRAALVRQSVQDWP